MLKNFVKGIADAIRRKEGSSDLISPMDFAQRIDNLQVGGGTDEGIIEYLDVSGIGDTNENLRNGLVLFADIVKSKNDEGTLVGACLTGIQTIFGFSSNNVTTCVAVAVDFSRHIKGKINDGTELDMSIYDLLIMTGVAASEQLDSIPRITKEQFYDLTT